MAAPCAGDELHPAHLVQAALAALKSRPRRVGPVALRDMDALCIKGGARCGPTVSVLLAPPDGNENSRSTSTPGDQRISSRTHLVHPDLWRQRRVGGGPDRGGSSARASRR